MSILGGGRLSDRGCARHRQSETERIIFEYSEPDRKKVPVWRDEIYFKVRGIDCERV